MKIRAGTTGAPDKMQQQEAWSQVLPIVQGLITQIVQLQAAGQDTEPLAHLLRETVRRFDERLEAEQFIPKKPAMPAMPGMPAGMPAPAV